MAEILSAEQDPEKALARAIAVLSDGEPVAIPTETVYGLAADATSGPAIGRIYETKERPRFNPLICHMADIAMASRHVRFDAGSLRLAEAFWPGPLTLVLPKIEQGAIHPLATAGRETAGVRVPSGLARTLIARFGRPLAAPSANRSGRISPTTAAHVAADIGDRISLILDAGPAMIGVESTVVKIEDGLARILRPGGITAGEIAGVLGEEPLRGEADGPVEVEAPGMLASHYAPQAAVRLNARDIRPGEAAIGFGGEPFSGTGNAVALFNLSARGDLAEAAARLFSILQQADASGAATIAVAPIPRHGLGEAINDRLARAAAPRPPTLDTLSPED